MKIEMFKASIETILLRFALMMACVIGGVLLDQLAIVLLSFPLLVSCLLAIKISFSPVKQAAPRSTKKPSTLVSE